MQKERTHPIKRSFTVTSIGYSKLNYLETGHPKSEKTFTNFKFDYALPYWNLFTSGRYTFLPLEKKNTNEELTFVDLDLHSAFRIPGVSFPWRLNLAAGIFYNNIFLR